MRKLVKFCLAMAMVGAMAAPAMAETKAGGWAMGALQSNTTTVEDPKDNSKTKSKTVVQNAWNAAMTLSTKAKVGSWESGAFAEIVLNSYGSLVADDAYVYVGNDMVEINMGKAFDGGITQGNTNDYEFTGFHDSSMKFGEYFKGGFSNNERLLIKAKSIGLDLRIHRSNADDVDIAAESLKYQGDFGPLSVKAYYGQGKWALNTSDNTENSYDTAKGLGSANQDGRTEKVMAFSVGYKINDKMQTGFNYESQATEKNDASGTKKETDTNMMVAFSMSGLPADSSVSASYGIGEDEDQNGTKVYSRDISVLDVTYSLPVGGASFLASYNSTTKPEKKDGSSVVMDKADSSQISVGLLKFF